MVYSVCIEETVSGEFHVEANSKEEALKIAKEKYNKCEFVNEPGELLEKKIAIRTDGECYESWEEF